MQYNKNYSSSCSKPIISTKRRVDPNWAGWLRHESFLVVPQHSLAKSLVLLRVLRSLHGHRSSHFECRSEHVVFTNNWASETGGNDWFISFWSLQFKHFLFDWFINLGHRTGHFANACKSLQSQWTISSQVIVFFYLRVCFSQIHMPILSSLILNDDL